MRIITRVSICSNTRGGAKIEGRADLLHVLHRGLGTLRTSEAEAGDQRLRIIEIVVADPGERQIGERLVALGELVEGNRVGGGVDAADGGEDDTLGLAGGARGVENDRGVRALAGFDFAVEPRSRCSVLCQRGTSILDDVVDRAQAAVVVIAQPAQLVVDDVLELR